MQTQISATTEATITLSCQILPAHDYMPPIAGNEVSMANRHTTGHCMTSAILVNIYAYIYIYLYISEENN